MNPTRPRTQAFTAGVVKSLSSDGQNTERAKEQRPVATIPARQPSETHVTGKKHVDKHQNRHRCGAGDLHRPCLCTHLEITGDETRSFQYAYAEPLKKAARARHGASVYERASIGLSLAGRFARWVKHPGGTAALLEQQRIRRIPRQ